MLRVIICILNNARCLNQCKNLNSLTIASQMFVLWRSFWLLQTRYDEDDEECGDSRAVASSHNSGMGAGDGTDSDGPTALQLQHQQFLGDASMVVIDFGSVRIDDNELLPEGITVEHLSVFETMYHAHCEVTCYTYYLLWCVLISC